MPHKVLGIYRILAEGIKSLPASAKFILTLIAVIVYSGWGDPAVKSAFGVYELNQEAIREMQQEKHKLQMRMMERDYRDSVKSVLESIYIDLSLVKGLEAYQSLNAVIENANTERASLLVVTGSADSLSIGQPAYGTYLFEISKDGIKPLGNDWQGAFIPRGLKLFLIKASRAEGPIISENVLSDSVFSDGETAFYLRKKEVKSMMASYIGKSPINSRHYFLLAFYHSEPIPSNDVSRDIYYVRNATVSIRRLFSLQLVKVK